MIERVFYVGKIPQDGLDVKVIVHTTMNHFGEKETFELITFGHLFKKKDAFYLKYEEILDELTVHTTMKITEHKVIIFRSGDLSMRMTFEEREIHLGEYTNPLGQIPIETKTNRLKLNMEETKGHIEVSYELYTQSDVVGTYHLQIKYEEEKNEYR